MIAVFYIGEDLSIFKSVPERFGSCDVINPPAFVIETDGGETLAPPALAVWFRVEDAEGVDPAAGQKGIHPGSFFREEAGGVFISFGIVDIDFFVGDVVIPAKDDIGF